MVKIWKGDRVKLTVEIPRKIWRQVKVKAAAEELTLQQVVLGGLMNFLKTKGEKDGR